MKIAQEKNKEILIASMSPWIQIL